jgi:MFS transporter
MASVMVKLEEAQPETHPFPPPPFMNPTRPSAPALYLAVVQFFFLSCWTVYSAFLPGLLEAAGLSRSDAVWLLMADQLVFALCDVAAGFAADRAHRLYGRIGPAVIAATALSCLAFLLLPWLAGTGQAALFLVATGIWLVTSSALRAPVFAMLSRHAAKPQAPWLAGLALAGTAWASAVAPYLSMVLKQLDPRLPFAVASLALLAVSCGLVWAERAAGRSAAGGDDALPPSLAPALLFPLIAVAALAFQASFSLNAAPRYLHDASPQDLPWLMPVFWFGFHFAVVGARLATQRFGAGRSFALGCLVGAAGALAASRLAGLPAAALGQLVAGAGWGLALAAAFGLVAECDKAGDRQASLTGLLFAMLALATFVRLAVIALGWAHSPHWTPLLTVFPLVAWPLAAAVAAWAAERHRRPLSSTG